MDHEEVEIRAGASERRGGGRVRRGGWRVDHEEVENRARACELRAGLLGPRVVSPHPQGLQGSHLNLSQTSAQRHRTYFLLNNKAVNDVIRE